MRKGKLLINKYENKIISVYVTFSGSEVAEFVAKHLPKEILGTETYKNGSLKQSLIDAFLGIDQKLISEEVHIYSIVSDISGIEIEIYFH